MNSFNVIGRALLLPNLVFCLAVCASCNAPKASEAAPSQDSSASYTAASNFSLPFESSAMAPASSDDRAIAYPSDKVLGMHRLRTDELSILLVGSKILNVNDPNPTIESFNSNGRYFFQSRTAVEGRYEISDSKICTSLKDRAAGSCRELFRSSDGKVYARYVETRHEIMSVYLLKIIPIDVAIKNRNGLIQKEFLGGHTVKILGDGELIAYIAGRTFTYGQVGINQQSEFFGPEGKFVWWGRTQSTGTYEVKGQLVCTKTNYQVSSYCRKILIDSSGAVLFSIMGKGGVEVSRVAVKSHLNPKS